MNTKGLHIDVRKRYRAAYGKRLAVSRALVVLVLVSCIAALGIAALGLVGILEGERVYLFASLSASVFMGSVWIFAYGVTDPTAVAPKKTVQEVLRDNGNFADTFEYRVVTLIGAYKDAVFPQESAHFLQSIVASGEVREMLFRLEIQPDDALARLMEFVAPDLSLQSLTHALQGYLANTSATHLSLVDIGAALLLHPRLRAWIRTHNIREEDIAFVAWWQKTKQYSNLQMRKWWRAENMLQFSGIGLSWAAGYTPFVDRFARIPKGSPWDVGESQMQYVEMLENSLAKKRQSNVLLIGQPGVGRIGVVRTLMARILTGKAHPALENQRVLYLHVSELLSFASSGADQLTFVAQALHEMERAGNVIVILDGLASVLGGEGSMMNLSDVLAPFFTSQTVRVVVVMSTNDYYEHFVNNQELEYLFEVVEVDPLSEEKTLELLALSVDVWEESGDIVLPYKALREVVENTATILPHVPFPEKAFDIVEELVVSAQAKGDGYITAEHVHALLAQKTGVNMGRFKEEESKRLLALPEFIHRRVVNQKQGVEAVARAMVRARVGIRSKNRPIGSFLFLGPTGVGKTETAKALAEAYFGSEAYLQRLDMSEFQGEDAIERLIGSISRPAGRLTSIAASHPFAIILLDEFEKASKSVQELFLPLFDEGYIVDARGRTYSFVHTMFIATSNAGSEFIRESVSEEGTLPADFDATLRENILSQGLFLPELLNRFDGVITFTPLTQKHVYEIARLMMQSLNVRLDAEHGVTVRVTNELLQYLAEYGYDPQFGARPMRRLIQDTVEYAVAKQLLAGGVEPGKEILLSPTALQSVQSS